MSSSSARPARRLVAERVEPLEDQIEPELELVALKELIDAGKVTPVIDRTYPLSETAAAIRYVADEHARAKVVITVP